MADLWDTPARKVKHRFPSHPQPGPSRFVIIRAKGRQCVPIRREPFPRI